MTQPISADGDQQPDDDQQRGVVLPVTSAHDGLEHLVAEEMMTIGNAGRYTGLCGRRVWAAVLACPPGPPCRGCIVVHHAHELGRQRKHRMGRRGVWTRLTGWVRRSVPR